MRKLGGNTYVGVLVGDGVVDRLLPPRHKGILGLLVSVKGRGLLNDEAFGLAVPPNQKVDGLIQVAEEFLLETA